MKKNLFETSLIKNETPLFFEGKGEYFSRNRENHGHSYVTHMTGWVANYIDNDQKKFDKVLEKLSDFLNGEVNKAHSLAAVNMNLIGLSRLLKNKPYSVDSTQKNISEKFYSSVSRYYNSLPPEVIDTRIQKKIIASISDNGCITLAKVIEKAII